MTERRQYASDAPGSVPAGVWHCHSRQELAMIAPGRNATVFTENILREDRR
jgi:hypothetical protein